MLCLIAGFFVLSNSALASVPSALDYAPNLWFDSQEQYYPVNPLDFYFENGQEISGQRAVTKYNQLSVGDKLNNLTVFYHIQDNGHQLVYQYWFFYVFNDSLGKIKNKHYGDWEAVFVFVNKNSKQVNKIIGTAHQRRVFDTEILNPSNSHTWNYVGAGSHASCVDDKGDGYCDFKRWRFFEKWDKKGPKVLYNNYKLKRITLDFVNKFGGKLTLENSPVLGISIPNFLEIIKKEIYIPLGGNPSVYAWYQSSYSNPQKLRPISSYVLETANQVKNGVVGFWGNLTSKLSNLFKEVEYQQAGIGSNLISPILTGPDSLITWVIPLSQPVSKQNEVIVKYSEPKSTSPPPELEPILPLESDPTPTPTPTPTSTPISELMPGSFGHRGVPQEQEIKPEPVMSSTTPSTTPSTTTPSIIPTSTPVVVNPVINEVQLGHYEFIELYNPNNQPIDMTGWYLSYYSSKRDWHNPYRNKQFQDGAIIPAQGFYLIGLNGYPESGGYLDADWQFYSSNQLHHQKGSIAIFPWDPTSTTSAKAKINAIDVLGWGEVDYVYKTTTSSPPGLNKSLVRQSDNEFIVNDWPSPRNSKEQTITVVPDSTAIIEDTTWRLENSPYILEMNSSEYPTIFSGATLSIEPGVIIKTVGKHYPSLIIKGVLKAQGTTSTPIVFTTINDAPQKGDWSGIVFDNSSAGSILEYVNFEYGGYTAHYQSNNDLMAMVKVINSQVTISNSNFRESEYSGIYLDNSDSSLIDCVFENIRVTAVVINGAQPSIINCQFSSNQTGIKIINQAVPIINDNTFSDSYYPITVISAYPSFNGNQASDSDFNGIFINQDSLFIQDFAWNNDLPYILSSGSGDFPTVASGTSLIIEPGVVIKSTGGHYVNLFIEGDLIVQGTTSTPIIFTSFKDDSYGGDTNNDNGGTTPSTGDWKSIRFEPGSSGNFDHVVFRYGSDKFLDIDDQASVVLGGDIIIEP